MSTITKRYDLRFTQPAASQYLVDEFGVIWIGKTNSPAGTFVTSGSTIIPAGGNGSSAWVEMTPTFLRTPTMYRAMAVPANGVTAVAATGITLASTGTATAASIVTTTRYTSTTRTDYLDTSAGTDSVAGVRSTNADWRRAVGFRVRSIFGIATGAAVATQRVFAGMVASTDAPTDVDPSTLVSMIGFGYDDTDATLQFMRNDAAGAAVKVDLGTAWPRADVDATRIYEMEIACQPIVGTTLSPLLWWIRDLTSGAEASGSVAGADADLPGGTTGLCGVHVYASVGGTSGVAGVSFGGFYGERPM